MKQAQKVDSILAITDETFSLEGSTLSRSSHYLQWLIYADTTTYVDRERVTFNSLLSGICRRK